jgi:hypothetical protein
MITNQTTKVKSGGSPCGCGGATTSLAVTCSCGGAGCNLCQEQNFVRPRFFAGQLLTEDDLQMLAEYTMAKSRLHNRFLFGQGVVCGLEVTCHPCGDGRVIVRPGYAIDCCGNDITLACEQLLDINAMIRDLRRKLLGFDCGDPCPDNQAGNRGAAGDANEQSGNTRHYCLYIRYCEEYTDPVSPYSTGESCAAQVCEPTRIREGLRFELRCREEESPQDDLFMRILKRLGDLDNIEKSSVDARHFQIFAGKTKAALREINANTPPPFEASHVQALQSALPKLALTLNQIPLPNGGPAGPEVVSEAAMRNVLDATLDTAGILARFYSRDAKDREMLKGQFIDLQRDLPLAAKLLSQAIQRVPSHINSATLPAPLERESALALLEVTENKLIVQNPPANDPEVRLLAEAVAFTPRVMAALTRSFNSLREWLLDRLDISPVLTDCGLRREVGAVIPPSPGAQTAISFSHASAYSTAAARLVQLFFRLLRDCLCLALNPACAPCDDTAVLLACLEVEGCGVARICNLERKFVLSPSAVRYWFPPIGAIGEMVENFCCPVDKFGDANASATLRGDRAFILPSSDFSQFAPAALSILPRTLSRDRRQDAKRLGRIAGLIFELFRDQAADTTLLRQPGTFGRSFMTMPEVAEETIAALNTPSPDTGRGFVPAMSTIMDEIANLIDARVESKLAARLQQEPVAQVEEKPSEPNPPRPKPEVKKNGTGVKRDRTKRGRKRPETDE